MRHSYTYRGIRGASGLQLGQASTTRLRCFCLNLRLLLFGPNFNPRNIKLVRCKDLAGCIAISSNTPRSFCCASLSLGGSLRFNRDASIGYRKLRGGVFNYFDVACGVIPIYIERLGWAYSNFLRFAALCTVISTSVAPIRYKRQQAA